MVVVNYFVVNIGHFPFSQNFGDFQSQIQWNRKRFGKNFQKKLGIRFKLILFGGVPELPKFLCSIGNERQM